MAHDIRRRDIQVGVEKAWHELTVVVPEITADNCGIIWPMSKQRLFLESKIPTDYFICVSDDDGLPIGSPVTKRYTVIPNDKIWLAVTTALKGTEHRIVSVGTCSDRQRGWISVKLDDGFVAANRKTQSVLNVLWGHGGVMNFIAKSGFTIVVCRNTYTMALQERGDFTLRQKHVGDADLRLLNMKDAIEAHAATVTFFMESMNSFHKRQVSHSEAREFFAGFVVEDFDPQKSKVSTRSQNMYRRLYQLFYSGAGNNGENGADLFNATTDYYSHEYAGGRKDAQRQFESSEFGGGQDRKQAVFELLSGNKVTGLGDYNDCVKRGTLVLSA